MHIYSFVGVLGFFSRVVAMPDVSPSYWAIVKDELTTFLSNYGMLEDFYIYATACLVMLISLLIIVVWSKWKASRRVVLLLGLSDSGKTLIFSRLLHEKFVNTYTSIKENVGEYADGNIRLRIVDIPGDERLRYKFFDRYKNMTGGMVYVIDSITFQKKIRDIAEFLYYLLSDPVVMANCPRFLILCNKQDDNASSNLNGMQSLLEKEMNLLRVTKTHQLQSIDETSNKKVFLGKEGADFKFSHINQIHVNFGEVAALNKDVGQPAELDYLKDWLEQDF